MPYNPYNRVICLTYGGLALNWNRSSLRTRVTVGVVAIAALAGIGLTVLFLAFAGQGQNERAGKRAVAASDQVKLLILQGRLPPVLSNGRNEAVQVVDSRGRIVAATLQLLGKPPMATFRPSHEQAQATRRLCPPAGLKGCKNVLSVETLRPGGTWLIYTATADIPWYGTSALLALGASLLMTVIATAGTFWWTTKAFAAGNTMRIHLQRITATGSLRRVPVPEPREVRLIAEMVNATLDRLEGAYRQLRQFTSDASHDLRGPITAMRIQVEEALMYPDDTDWPQTAITMLAEVDRMQALVDDLLTLTRLEAGRFLIREPIDLTELVGAELDRRAYRVKVVKDLRAEVYVECDRLSITRLLANLIDNAERHATSQITVMVRAEGATAALEVIDDGEGIALELREAVFERFTRLEASRERDADGTGLGLAIAREIAQVHEGSLTIRDSDRGARFVLCLPTCDRLPRR
jgi:signal transduction histidine kinase